MSGRRLCAVCCVQHPGRPPGVTGGVPHAQRFSESPAGPQAVCRLRHMRSAVYAVHAGSCRACCFSEFVYGHGRGGCCVLLADSGGGCGGHGAAGSTCAMSNKSPPGHVFPLLQTLLIRCDWFACVAGGVGVVSFVVCVCVCCVGVGPARSMKAAGAVLVAALPQPGVPCRSLLVCLCSLCKTFLRSA